ncbi:beta-1,4-N-acetylgalactosaminyltransferase bre-4 [Plutella xylostella]|uniref:beta-1,4-N-acetylgalactosaminyltransferase bre-4 n=1 Tax=Plutella xylostella TaxID=51655 RepID=UPI00203281C6|nr:beta-1,4-N-acetylgalactosaminyltransferase bre-4 [Plutella xylostella]
MHSSKIKYFALFLVVAAAILHLTNYLIMSKTVINTKYDSEQQILKTIRQIQAGQTNFYRKAQYLARAGVCPEPNVINDTFEAYNTDLNIVDETDINLWSKTPNEGLTTMCPLYPENVGPIPEVTSIGEPADYPKMASDVFFGGVYRPHDCVARQTVAVIVPYIFRDHMERLAAFLYSLHPVLVQQQLEYRLFVVYSNGSSITRPPMSVGRLMNIGVQEANRYRGGPWNCYIFHDPEMYPLDSRNLYRCLEDAPRQLVSSVVPFTFQLHGDKWIRRQIDDNAPETEVGFGGVLAMTFEQFKKVNGFTNSNTFLIKKDTNTSHFPDMVIRRSRKDISKYAFIGKSLRTPAPFAYNKTTDEDVADGFSSLNYTLKYTKEVYLYTLISVDEFYEYNTNGTLINYYFV